VGGVLIYKAGFAILDIPIVKTFCLGRAFGLWFEAQSIGTIQFDAKFVMGGGSGDCVGCF
jgi:hypothetical protein